MAQIGVLTHHWAKADRVAEAKALLERNGAAQSRAPGFRRPSDFRFAVRPDEDFHAGDLGKQRNLRCLARQPGAGGGDGGGRGAVGAAAGIGAV